MTYDELYAIQAKDNWMIYSHNLGEWSHLDLVLRQIGKEYVTHIFNRQSTGYCYGQYFSNLEDALNSFFERKHDYQSKGRKFSKDRDLVGVLKEAA